MSVVLRLFNPETQETFEFSLSAAEAERAETDLEFATRLMEAARTEGKQQVSVPLFSPGTCSSSSAASIADDDVSHLGEVASEEPIANGFKWPNEAILLLVEEYRAEEKNLASGRISQKKVWERIALVLQGKGFKTTGAQCLTKFNGMKRTYKSIKDHNSKSGNNLRSWPYLDIMQSVLGEKPFMQPVATASSTGSTTLAGSRVGCGNDTPSTSRSNSRVGCVNDTPSTSRSLDQIETPTSVRKRKSSSEVAEAILASRRISEENKERRHKEKMLAKKEFQNKMIRMMGELIDKI